MKKLWLIAAFAAMSAGAQAQETGGAGETKVAFGSYAYPFEGEVAASRLNVRMFPNADAESVIASVLPRGSKVTVVGEKEMFYQIVAPKGCTAWIYGRSVRREGGAGTVMASDVPVRMDSRVTSQPLCTLKRGTEVKVVGQHMGWYKIAAPVEVKYFIAKKYVHPIRGLASAGVSATPFKDGAKKTEPAVAPVDGAYQPHLDVANALLEEQKQLVAERRLEDVDFENVIRALELAKEESKTPDGKAEVDKVLVKYLKIHNAFLAWKGEVQKKQLEVQAEVADLAKKPAPPKTWAMTGYVDTTGLLWKRPGTHKLVMGGKIVCFLRVKEGDKKMVSTMNGHFRKYVGVNGTLIRNPEGWDGYSVVVVDEIVQINRK